MDENVRLNNLLQFSFTAVRGFFITCLPDFNLRKSNKLIFVLNSDIVVEVNIRTKDFRTQNPFGLSTVCRTITAADLSLPETLPSAM